MPTTSISALSDGVNLDPASHQTTRATLADLAALAPHWLDRPLHNEIAVIWLSGSRPVTCVGVALSEPDPVRRLNSVIREAGNGGCNVAVIAYTDLMRAHAVIDYQCRPDAALLRVYPGQQAVLICAQTGGRAMFWRSPDPATGWKAITVPRTPSESRDPEDADCRAWGRWGVLDAAHVSVPHRDPRWELQVPRARKDRAAMSETDRYVTGLRAVKQSVELASLPGPGQAVDMGEGVLDCRILAQSLELLAKTTQPRVAVWSWAARLLPGEGHWAAGMAGLAYSLAGRHSAARKALQRQWDITDDPRTRALVAAVNAADFPAAHHRVVNRAWDCERPCCTRAETDRPR